MSRFVMIVLVSIGVAASACAGSPPFQGTKLLFQTLTLLPDKTETISLPERLNTRSGRISVLVAVDREVSLPSGEADPHEGLLVLDGKKAASFSSSVRTSDGRTMGHKSVELDSTDQASLPSTRVVFRFNISLNKDERVNDVSFRCGKKITILEVVWLPGT